MIADTLYSTSGWEKDKCEEEERMRVQGTG